MALLPELCETEENRVQVVGVQGIFFIIGNVLGIVLPMMLQSNLEDPTKARHWEPSGQYLVQTLPWIGGGFALFSFIFLLYSILSIDESYLHEISAQISEEAKEKSLKGLFSKMFSPLSNNNFRIYLLAMVFFNIGFRILNVALVPVLTYVLQLVGVLFIIFILIVMPFAFLGFLYWNKQIPRFGLLNAYRKNIVMLSLALLFTVVLLIPMNFWLRFVLGLITVILAIGCLVGGYLFPSPVISSFIDESTKKMNVEQPLEALNISGAYFGLNSFALNIAGALANFLVGLIFMGDNSENPTIIGLSLPVASVFVFICFLLMGRIQQKIPNAESNQN